MVMEYNKKGRTSGSSPRDLQKRNSNSGGGSLDNKLVLDLLTRVSSMTLELEELKRDRVNTPPATVVSSDKKYTEDEFNTELIKALEKELENNTEVIKLKEELKSLKVVIDIREELIDNLKSQIIHDSKFLNKPIKKDKISKRPSIEESVIDPTESKSDLDPHINVEEVAEEKADMIDKVGKLKELLGG